MPFCTASYVRSVSALRAKAKGDVARHVDASHHAAARQAGASNACVLHALRSMQNTACSMQHGAAAKPMAQAVQHQANGALPLLLPCREASSRIQAILAEFGPAEKLGLDELFVDITKVSVLEWLSSGIAQGMRRVPTHCSSRFIVLVLLSSTGWMRAVLIAGWW